MDALTALLTTVLKIAGAATSSSQVGIILDGLAAALPAIEEGGIDMYNTIKQTIADLKSSGVATPEQLALADKLDADADAQFDEAIKAYRANHPEAGPEPDTTTGA